ncbi:vacuolar amino acid transporter 3 [Arthroderma uncinatum]|uniref:vacuolar amino acid transporter 3 n=1 Tax=Arthroderma uncinatum TaxID=74035 RepID=UPI00144AB00A|nr:vacuolar amino acid transporter 3 [Arthroderma uncinatum]KAF3481625.1 vacuolar amino acid transporter 3 [Arthroderma uncinatum]
MAATTSEMDKGKAIPTSNGQAAESTRGRAISSTTPPEGGLAPGSLPRHLATARLASPVPSSSFTEAQDLQLRRVPTPRQTAPPDAKDATDFKASSVVPSSPDAPRPSALTSALQDENASSGTASSSSGAPLEDAEVVKRHLVQPPLETADSNDANGKKPESTKSGGSGSGKDAAEEFSSLKLQGGDITRPIYRWAEAEAQEQQGPKRRKSFDLARPEPEAETLDINTIRVPGGFRRDYLRRTGGEQNTLTAPADPEQALGQPRLPTNSFLEFLTLFGHFAGEELEEDDEVLGPGEFFTRRTGFGEEEPSEETSLLRPGSAGGRTPKDRAAKATNTSMGAVLLLLKSFVGTGVLFLPRAFLNGGMVFSSIVLVAISALSYYCFILLVNTRNKINGSFGDMGGVLYGEKMRKIILLSVALSQLGFVAAYIVFVSQNLQAFILSVSNCETFMNIKYVIMMQLIIFLPLSLVRDISKLAFTALIADVFILLGLVYLYGFGISTIMEQGVADIQPFNPKSYTLLIGTAIFTFEGIGLIIPIQESMKRPEKFPGVLALVMVVITVVFLSMGVVGYATFGSATETVVILNLPQQDNFVRAIQFLYAIAILLSTPLQLFPAIRILENGLFTRSGKYNPGIKWKKNIFRFFLVLVCASIAWGGAGDLDKFVSLIGSFACVPLVFVYPPMLHYKGVATTRLQKSLDICLMTFGMLCCAYTTALTLKNWAGGSSAPKLPGYCDK